MTFRILCLPSSVISQGPCVGPCMILKCLFSHLVMTKESSSGKPEASNILKCQLFGIIKKTLTTVPSDTDDIICHKIMWRDCHYSVLFPWKDGSGPGSSWGGGYSPGRGCPELVGRSGGRVPDLGLLQCVSHWVGLVSVKLGKLR